MSKKKYQVRGECPQCACGTITHLTTEQVKEKYIGPEEEFLMNCPIAFEQAPRSHGYPG